MSDKPEKIEWRELDWRYCGLVGGVKFYLIQRKVYTEPELHNTAIIEILETGEWWEFDTVKEAKAKAEELLTEWIIRADLAKPSEWISVDDRLPGDDKPKAMYSVIVAKTNGVVLEAMYNNLVHKFLSTRFDDLNHPVTHWKPLPPPPTRETP